VKNLFKLFGIIAFLAVIGFSMVGCELFEGDEFPSEFRGTWERDYTSVYANTLTFTSNTIKDSTQSYYWDLKSVSGDNYTVNTDSTTYTIYIKYENGNLNFGADNTSGEHDWQGKWKRK
jgi:hypothetical protein